MPPLSQTTLTEGLCSYCQHNTLPATGEIPSDANLLPAQQPLITNDVFCSAS